MPTLNQRPDPNILDLRKLVAERRAEELQPRRRGLRLTPRTPRLSSPHRPAGSPRDWTQFRRELLKFSAVLGAVAILSGGIFLITRAVNAKTSVERTSRQGADQLQQGLSFLGQSQPEQAVKAFADAAATFQQASTQLEQAVPTGVDRVWLVGGKVSAGRRLLQDAIQLSQAGRELSAILPTDNLNQPAVQVTSNGLIQGSVGILAAMLQHRPEFISAVGKVVAAVNDLTSVPSSDLPGSLRDKLTVWQRLVTGLVGNGESLDHLTTFLLNLLAPSTPQEYLVVFENNDEIRPTGGFLGTFLLMEFSQGGFKVLDAPGNGPFALSDVIAKQNLPPQPIQTIAPYWTFHDANWFLDVPTSAQTMLDMYQQDRGFRPDGVLFLTPAVMEDLLRITGPLRPEKYNVDISADNFVAATEQQVQFGYDKALNNPKQFLIDLVPTMLTKLSQLSGPDALRAVALTLKNATQGNILAYSDNADMQSTISTLGWSGAIITNDHDYLAVVDTNLGGGKTDRSIDEKVSAVVTLQGASLRHVVSVTRTHHGTPKTISGDTNQDFLRVYAPSNAQFVGITGATKPEASWFMASDPASKMPIRLQNAEGQTLIDTANGYRITHESGKTVFGAWSTISPGESQTITFTYDTPAPNNGSGATWQLDWQHQPGGVPIRAWNVAFNVPTSMKISDTTPLAKTISKHSATFESNSTLNRSFAVSYK